MLRISNTHEIKIHKILRKILLNENGVKSEIKSKNAEMFLFLADRAEHYERVVKPNKNELILCDRVFISGISYALANDEKSDFNELVNLNKIALQNDFGDKFIFYKISENDLISRLKQRNLEFDRIDKRGISYLLKVQENMEKCLKALNLDFLTINAVEKIDEIDNCDNCDINNDTDAGVEIDSFGTEKSDNEKKIFSS